LIPPLGDERPPDPAELFPEIVVQPAVQQRIGAGLDSFISKKFIINQS
jgi:hypothetical protein